jgi:hypothetical protein
LLGKGKEGQKVQLRRLRPAITAANGLYALRVPAGRLPKKYVDHGSVNFEVWLMDNGVAPFSTYTEFPAHHGRRGDGVSSNRPTLVDFDLGTHKIIEHNSDGTVQRWPLNPM